MTTIDNTQLISWRFGKGLFTLSVAVILSFTLAALAQSAPFPGPARAAEALTHQLVGLNKRLQHASPTARARVLDELQAVATKRQALLSELIASDPGAVMRVALPQHIRAGMPKEVRAFIEQWLNLEGELEVLYEDYEDGSVRLRHFLKVFDERISLHFKGGPPGLLSGTAVSTSGVLLDGAMALESSGNILTLAADGGTDGGTNAGAAAPVPNTFGEQRTAVLLVNFVGLPQEPWTIEEAVSTVFNTVNDFINENSYGQTWINGDVFGWLTIDIDPAGCPTMDIATAAQGAAASQGIDLSGYNRLIYAFPDIGCSWSGQATVGGNPSRAWLDGTLLNSGIVSHELGHNFGLHHSHALECGSDVVGENCLTAEYGDALDRMGNSSAGHFNAFQKSRLGWLDFGTSPAIVTAESSGIYQLETFASQTQGTKAIRIPRDIDPVTGQNRWYFLESRQALGFDSFLATSRYGASVTNGLTFRLGVEGDPNSSSLLDMTPDSQIYDWDDLALLTGISFTDTASGTTVALEQISSTGATVSIDFGASTCIHHAPTIVLSPSQGPWVSPGTPVGYEATVTNNDSDSCSTTGFDLSTVAQAGWNVELADSALQIAPGASGSVAMTVTSPPTENEGFYDITVTVENSNDSTLSATTVATYVIEPAGSTPNCTAQPSQITISPAVQSGDPGTTLSYEVSLTNNDSQECSPSTYNLTRILPGWSGSISPNTMTLAPGASGFATLAATSLNTTESGSYTLQVMAYDDQEPAHDASANATYVVNETGETDTTPPTAPEALTANTAPKQVGLAWNPSYDNVSVAGYRVLRDGVLIATTPETGYTDRDLASNVLYQYSVEAYDSVNNISARSNTVTAGKAKGKGSGGGKGKGKNN